MKQWFYTRKGKQKEFWKPTWQNDFTITDDLVSSNQFIDVETTPTDPVFDIQIEMLDGTLIRRKVLTKAVQGDGERLNLDATVDLDAPVADVRRVSLFSLMRNDSDSITITHENHTSAQAKVPVKDV
jgi:hypothetical protein